MKRNVTIGFIALLSAVAVGAVVYFWPSISGGGQQSDDAIRDFDDCARAGNPVAESFPRQCRTVDGRLFVEERVDMDPPQGPNPGICENKCGDGVCQEIVCMGTGCPCAETENNCPADCR